MDRSPVAPGQSPQGPMEFAQKAERSAADGPAVSGEASGQAQVPQPEMGKGRTIIASGVEAVAGPQGGVTGRAQPGEQPDTMYFKRGTTEPERVSTGGGVDEVAVPSSSPAVEGNAPGAHSPAPISEATPAVAPGRSAPVAYEEPGGGNKTVLIVVGVVVVIGVVAAAILML